MPSRDAVVAAAVRHSGKPYNSGPGRFGPSSFDCSGLIVTAWREAGGHMPATVSSTQYAYCRDRGALRPIAQAQPGDLLFAPSDNPLRGIGPEGHVAMVRGSGLTIEAVGGRGVGSWPIAGRTTRRGSSLWYPLVGVPPGLTGAVAPSSSTPTPAQHRKRANMVILDTNTGVGWFLGIGAARGMPNMAEALECARGIGQTWGGKPIVFRQSGFETVIWMIRFGAWDFKNKRVKQVA